MRSSASAKTRFMASARASTRVGALSHDGGVVMGALCLLALLVLALGLATVFELTRELPRLDLLPAGDGRIIMLDPDGAAARAGLRLGDHLTAVDGLGFSSQSLAAVAAHAPGDLVDVTVGAPGSYALFQVPASAPSATELAGDSAVLAAALVLWLCGLAVGLLRRRAVAARLYAAAAVLLALALCALVASGMGMAWAAPALPPAAFLGLGFLTLAQGALGQRNGWPLVALVLLLCGAPAAAALVGAAIPPAGPIGGALLVLLGLASLLAVVAPWYWHARTAAELERRRWRVAGLAVLAGLVPAWLWPGATIIAALRGRAVAVPAAWHLSALWGCCSLALLAALFSALLLSPQTRLLDVRLRCAVSYVAAAALTLACWLAIRPSLAPLGQVALAVVLVLLNPALQRWLDRILARLVRARVPDYAQAERLIEEMTVQAASPDTLAAALTRELPGLLGMPAMALLWRDDGPTRAYRGFLAGAHESAARVVAPLPDEVLKAYGPVWSPLANEPAPGGPLGRLEPALWAPLRWDGAVQAMLGVGPCNRDEADVEEIGRLARLLALALHTKLLLANLHERTRALAGLTHRLSHAHEQERANLSRELHDVVAQELIALTRHLRRYGEDHPPPPAIWADMLAGAQDALVATRRICNGLRPAILDLGLAPALRDLVAAMSDQQAAPEVMLAVHGPEQRWPADLEFALFRVAQEGLNNALAHAQARQIQIALDFQDGLRLYVRDDGRGFTVPPRFEDLPGDHLGLIGMRERVAEFDGTLTVTSSPGRGTTLEVRLPPRNT